MLLWQESHIEHWLENLLTMAALVVSIFWRLRAERKKEEEKAEKGRAAFKAEQDKKHEENTKALAAQDKVLFAIAKRQKFLPAHFHREKSGPLKAENIHMPEDDD